MEDLFLKETMDIPFYGRDILGANFLLTYCPKRIDLEISAYSHKGYKSGTGIVEVALFSTYPNKDGRKFQTDLTVGESLVYHSGNIVNNSISQIIDDIQKSDFISLI